MRDNFINILISSVFTREHTTAINRTIKLPSAITERSIPPLDINMTTKDTPSLMPRHAVLSLSCWFYSRKNKYHSVSEMSEFVKK
jgi:hypothetical protein